MPALPHTRAGVGASKWPARLQQLRGKQSLCLDEYLIEKHPSAASSVLSLGRSDTLSARHSVGPSPISQTTVLGEVGSPDAEYDADTSQLSSGTGSSKESGSGGGLRSSEPVASLATSHYTTPPPTAVFKLPSPATQGMPTRQSPPSSLPAVRHSTHGTQTTAVAATATTTSSDLYALYAQVAQRDSTIATLKARLRAAGATLPQPRDARGRFASPDGPSAADGRKTTTGRVQRSERRRRRRTQTELLMEAGIMFGYIDQIPNVSHVTGEPVVVGPQGGRRWERREHLDLWTDGSENEVKVWARGLVGDICRNKRQRE